MEPLDGCTFYSNSLFASIAISAAYNPCFYDNQAKQLIGDYLPNDEEEVVWYFRGKCGCFSAKMKYGEIDAFVDPLPPFLEKEIVGWAPLDPQR